jgi:hypothetical protein
MEFVDGDSLARHLRFSSRRKIFPQISLSRPVAYLCSRLAINV